MKHAVAIIGGIYVSYIGISMLALSLDAGSVGSKIFIGALSLAFIYMGLIIFKAGIN